MNTVTHKPQVEKGTAGSFTVRRTVAAPAFKPEVVRSVRMHPVLAATVAAVVFTLLVAYALHMKPVWLAETQVYVEPETAKLIGEQGVALFDSTRYDSVLQQQMQVATRPDILEQAIATLPAGTWQQPGEPLPAAVARLASQLSMKRVGTSYQMAIDLKAPTPNAAAATVNAVTEAYLRAGRKDALAQTGQRAQLLAEERQHVETELAEARREQAALSVSLGVANASSAEANPYDPQLATLRAELQAARQAHDQAAAQLDAYSATGAHSAGLAAAADEAISTDASLTSLKSSISSRRAQLEGQMAGLTPNNPIYKQDQDEIADLDRSLDRSTVQIRGHAEGRLEDKLKAELDRTGDVETRLNAQLGRMTATATGATPKLQRATELAADIQRLMTRYASVDDSLRALQLDANGPGMVRLVMPAAVPAAPEPNRKHLLLLAAIPLAALAGIGAAIFARKRDPRVYLGRDLEDVLGFAPVAVLPAPADVSDEVRAECLLRLAGGVEGAYRTGGTRSFVFTAVSAHTDASNLVRLLGERLRSLGLAVVVVDAATLLEVPATTDRGLSTASRHESFVEHNLALRKLAGDLVFVEAPALLASAHTEYVARSADTTILIAESGVTTRGELAQAGSLLQRLQVAGVGAVLDGLELRVADAAFRNSIAAMARQIESAPRAQTYSPLPDPPAGGGSQQPAWRSESSQSAHWSLHTASPVAVPASIHIVEQAETPPASSEPAAPLQSFDPPAAAKVDLAESSDEEPLATLTEPAAVEAPLAVPLVAEPAVSGHAESVVRAMPAPVPVMVHTMEEPVDEVTEKKSWFDRMFRGDRGPIVSLIPDGRVDPADETQAVPELARTDTPPAEPEPLQVEAPEEADFAWMQTPIAAPAQSPRAVTFSQPLSFLELTQMQSNPASSALDAAPVQPGEHMDVSAWQGDHDEPVAPAWPGVSEVARCATVEPLQAPPPAGILYRTAPAGAAILSHSMLAIDAADIPASRPCLRLAPARAVAQPVRMPAEVVTQLVKPQPVADGVTVSSDSAMTTGRWDPIPTLRPGAGRERPAAAVRQAPMPVIKPVAHQKAETQPERESSPDIAQSRQLTRNWSLLSRFDQADGEPAPRNGTRR